MRKVLFATTALVALGGVSAASADISVSAANEFKYSSWSDNYAASTSANKSSFSSTTSYKISASTVTDNGLTMSSFTAQDGSSGAFDDMGFTIGGDFGTLGFGASESGDAFETATDVTPDEGNSLSTTDAALTALPADAHVDGSSVSYKSPAIGGFQFAAGINEGGASDGSSFGAQYSMTAGDSTVTLKYAQSGGKKALSSHTNDIEATSVGLVVAYGDLTVTLADNSKSTDGYGAGTVADPTVAAYDFSAQSIGVTYAMNDALTVSAYTGSTEDGKDSSHEMTDTGFGAAYTVTPGLVLNVTYNDWSLKDSGLTNRDGSKTSVALNLSF
jgi:hypothetical protein